MLNLLLFPSIFLIFISVLYAADNFLIPGEGDLDLLNFFDAEPNGDAAALTGTPKQREVSTTSVAAVVGRTVESSELASPELKYIAKTLLSYTLADLAQRLTALGPQEVKKSLSPGCNWNLLHEAVMTDNVEVAELLILHFGFDPNKFDDFFGNCVYLVNSVRMVRMLLENGTNFNISRSCHLYANPEESAFQRFNAAFYSCRDSISGNERINLAIDKVRAIQQSGSVKQFKSSSKEKMYRHALGVVKGFTVARNPNARIKVSYNDEIGVDAGGLTVDFITHIKNEIIKNGQIFVTDPETGRLDLEEKAPVPEIRLFGFIVGLSIFHRVPLGILFAPIIYHLLCAQNPHRDINFLSVLAESSPDTYKGLENLKDCPDKVLKTIEAVQLQGDSNRPWKRRKDFINDREGLCDYIKLSAKMLVFDSRARVYEQFLIGVGQAIDCSVLSLELNPDDLKLIIKGQLTYTAADMRADSVLIHVAIFPQLYDWLFEIIEDMTDTEREHLLKFFTSLDCLPVGGFKNLDEKIKIEVLLRSDTPDEMLPEAATCFNTLKLHAYTSKSILKARLLKAINECVGFYLA